MRISDWSSDVCSSDLDDAAAFRLRCEGIGHEKFVRFLLPVDDGEGQGVAEGRHEIGCRGEFGIEFRQVRSEEHTSELQSLMRISYAVFCLKKKTDIIQ